jgi:hypothetical protein
MDLKHTWTLLTRLASRKPEVACWLGKVLQDRLESVDEVALNVAIETGDPMGRLLAAVVEEQGSSELVRRLETRCAEDDYNTSIPLREISLVATRKTVEELMKAWPSPDAEQRQELARLLNNLSNH